MGLRLPFGRRFPCASAGTTRPIRRGIAPRGVLRVTLVTPLPSANHILDDGVDMGIALSAVTAVSSVTDTDNERRA